MGARIREKILASDGIAGWGRSFTPQPRPVAGATEHRLFAIYCLAIRNNDPCRKKENICEAQLFDPCYLSFGARVRGHDRAGRAAGECSPVEKLGDSAVLAAQPARERGGRASRAAAGRVSDHRVKPVVLPECNLPERSYFRGGHPLPLSGYAR